MIVTIRGAFATRVVFNMLRTVVLEFHSVTSRSATASPLEKAELERRISQITRAGERRVAGHIPRHRVLGPISTAF